MSESKEYLIRVIDHGPGEPVTIRDLSEPVRAFRPKISVPDFHVPREEFLFQDTPVIAIVRSLRNKATNNRERAKRYKEQAVHWEAVARYLAGRCHELEKAQAWGTLTQWHVSQSVRTPDQWLELAKENTEPKKENDNEE